MRALAIAVVAGCTAAHAVPHPRVHEATLAGAIVAVPGETMEFRVSLRGVKLGLVQTAVGWPGLIGDRPAVIVRSRGKTEGLLSLFGDLTWELSSTIDTARGLPIEDHEEAWAVLAGDKHHENHHHHWADGDTRHDIHSAVASIRGWQSRPGDRTNSRSTSRERTSTSSCGTSAARSRCTSRRSATTAWSRARSR